MERTPLKNSANEPTLSIEEEIFQLKSSNPSQITYSEGMMMFPPPRLYPRAFASPRIRSLQPSPLWNLMVFTWGLEFWGRLAENRKWRRWNGNDEMMTAERLENGSVSKPRYTVYRWQIGKYSNGSFFLLSRSGAGGDQFFEQKT